MYLSNAPLPPVAPIPAPRTPVILGPGDQSTQERRADMADLGI